MKHSAPFWSWNGKLNAKELRRQMRYLKKMGFGGVFMHSRTGLMTEYLSKRWFDMIRACIDEGKQINLKTWIYDEDRWPSGYAGGFVTRHEKHRLKWIYMDEKQPDTPAAPGKKVRSFNIGGRQIDFTVGCATSSSWYNGYCYANVMDRRTTQAFIDMTHERYLQECKPGDFPGVFTDEPQYGFFATVAEWSNSQWYTVPYDPKLRAIIKKRYDYDIFDRLPELFSRQKGGLFNIVRYHYVKTATELFRKNNVAVIGAWHKKHNLVYTGHMMGEDSLISQTWNCGDPMSFYPYFGMPGIDQLGACSFNHLPPRQLGSVARQYGQKDRLAEIYGSTGWDYPPEGHKLIGDLLLGHGINFRCQHLSDYTLAGETKRDYPASISFHLPWSSDYHLLEERFDLLTDRLYDYDRYAEVLVISPVESVWGMAFAGFTDDKAVNAFDIDYDLLLQKLQKEDIAFDIGSEILLSERGKVSKGKLSLGKASYRAVVLPKMITMRAATLELLKRFTASGGTLIFSDTAPEMIDGMELKEKFPLSSAPWESLEKFKRWSIPESNGMIFASLYRKGNSEQLLLTNTSCTRREDGSPWNIPMIQERNTVFRDLTIRWKSDCMTPPCGYDPEKDIFYPVEYRRDGDEWVIRCDFDRLQSRLLVLDKKAVPQPAKLSDCQWEYVTLPQEFEYSLNDKNILLFDHFCCDQLDDKEHYILDIDNLLRDKLGIPRRRGDMVQPWAAPKLPEVTPLPFILKNSFESAISGQVLELAIENPELNTPFLNGIRGTVKKGKWFLDPAFRIIEFPAEALKKGKNILEIHGSYSTAHPGLEAVYLRGDFAVDRAGTRIFPLPEKLHRGDMTDQGLPFFCGGVKCRFEIKRNTAPLKLRLPRFYGALVRVKLSGKAVGVIWHSPYETDLTDFLKKGQKALLELELVNSPRNMMGPFYSKGKYPNNAPLYFTVTETEERKLVPLGFGI